MLGSTTRTSSPPPKQQEPSPVDFDIDVPAGTYRIEAFTNPAGADSTGYGEGEVFAGPQTIVHTGSGPESFQLTYSGSVDEIVTLTATEDLGGSYGSTSEFSSAAVVGAARVNSTGDSSDAVPGDHTCDTGGTNSEGEHECTLRAAIEEANASALVDAVVFNIPTSETGYGAAPLRYTIRLASALPDHQPGDRDRRHDPTRLPGTPIIDLWGIDIGSGSGLDITAGNSTVRGLVLRAFPAHGIELRTGGSNVIEDNYIGTDVTGLADVGNGDDGISIRQGSSDNTIGGIGVGNVIAFNARHGVDVEAGDRNAIFYNSIFGNADLGINLTGGIEDGFEVTANDVPRRRRGPQ